MRNNVAALLSRLDKSLPSINSVLPLRFSYSLAE
jgi:hypothetical protein